MKMHLRSLDVLRGIAAAWVMLFHLWHRFFRGLSTFNAPFHAPSKISLGYLLTFPTLQYGYHGVTLFFVLSGFCIHLPQARGFAKNGADSLSVKEFARRRFWRLYPAYIASIVFSMLAMGSLPTVNALAKHSGVDIVSTFGLRDAAIHAFFVESFFEPGTGLNGVYWTLYMEVQFYLVYPMLLWIMRRAGWRPVLIALLAVEVFFAYRPPPVAHLFFTRYFEWYLGVVAAEWYVAGSLPSWLGPAGVAALALGLASPFSSVVFPLQYILVSTGWFAGGLWLVNAETTGAFSTAPGPVSSRLELVGLFSYSLYLIHVPIIDVLWNGLTLVSKKGILGIELAHAVALASLPLSLVLAYQFYQLFEKPFLKVGANKPREARS